MRTEPNPGESAALPEWTVVSSETLLDQPPWMRVERQQVDLPNGLRIDEYLVSIERDYSMIVAITNDDQVILVRQYKHGIGAVLREFPAGYIDGSETPLAAAIRELAEETGFEAATWTSLGAFHVSPTRGPARGHFFLARGLMQSQSQHLDDTEDLTIEFVGRDEVGGMLASGRMPSLANAAAWCLATYVLDDSAS